MPRLFADILTYIGKVVLYTAHPLFKFIGILKEIKPVQHYLHCRLIVTWSKNKKLRKIKYHIYKIAKITRKKIKQMVLNIKHSRLINLFKKNKFISGVIFSLMFILAPIFVINYFNTLPNVSGLQTRPVPKPTQILDRNENLLYEIYIDTKYSNVELTKIPDIAVKSAVAVEDADFYKHHGLSLKSIIRAAYKTIFEDSLQGGSTITQQLVKNTLITKERTLSRKIKEAALALKLERKYSKDQIMEMYLNNIPYGGSAWGIQSAAQKYYGKDIWDLTDAEITMLAGLPTSPSLLSPLTDIEKAKERQRYVLDRMVTLGYLTQENSDDIYNQELTFAQQGEYIRAPHFVAYIREQLEKKYGKRFVDYSGLKIVTSLDLDLQEIADQTVKEEVENSKKLNISNGAAVVADVEKAEILAYVGSIDYFKEGWGSYDVVQSLRQPGSAIKPVTYSVALTKGFTAASVITDSPVRYKFEGSPDYTPVNYDGRYHGNVTLRQALANSYNIPAVKVASKIGPKNILQAGKDYGLTTWEDDGNYGLSITLGGRDVKLFDLVNVYATLARSGEYKELNSILLIEDSTGHKLFEKKNIKGEKVLSPEAAYIISNILADNEARKPAFGYRNNLEIAGYNVAVKTGTTDNKRDNWTLGYTPSFVVGVWVGNNDNQPMNPNLASGLSGAAPIWNKITSYLVKNTGYYVSDFKVPDGVYKLVDKNCGNKTEYFIKGVSMPASLCSPKDKDKNKDSDGKKQALGI